MPIGIGEAKHDGHLRIKTLRAQIREIDLSIEGDLIGPGLGA